MTKEEFSIIMEFYKRLNYLYDMGIILEQTYNEIVSQLMNNMLDKYEDGDPLDKVY